MAEYAVDGLILSDPLYFHSIHGELRPYLAVDLRQKYQIKFIRFITRISYFDPDRFIHINVSTQLTVNFP